MLSFCWVLQQKLRFMLNYISRWIQKPLRKSAFSHVRFSIQSELSELGFFCVSLNFSLEFRIPTLLPLSHSRVTSFRHHNQIPSVSSPPLIPTTIFLQPPFSPYMPVQYSRPLFSSQSLKFPNALVSSPFNCHFRSPFSPSFCPFPALSPICT